MPLTRHPLLDILEQEGMVTVREAVLRHLDGPSAWALSALAPGIRLDVPGQRGYHFTFASGRRRRINRPTRLAPSFWDIGGKDLTVLGRVACCKSGRAKQTLDDLVRRLTRAPDLDLATAAFTELCGDWANPPCHWAVREFWCHLTGPSKRVFANRLRKARFVYGWASKCCAQNAAVLEFFWNSIVCMASDPKAFGRDIAHRLMGRRAHADLIVRWARLSATNPDWPDLHEAAITHGHDEARLAIEPLMARSGESCPGNDGTA